MSINIAKYLKDTKSSRKVPYKVEARKALSELIEKGQLHLHIDVRQFYNNLIFETMLSKGKLQMVFGEGVLTVEISKSVYTIAVNKLKYAPMTLTLTIQDKLVPDNKIKEALEELEATLLAFMRHDGTKAIREVQEDCLNTISSGLYSKLIVDVTTKPSKPKKGGKTHGK